MVAPLDPRSEMLPTMNPVAWLPTPVMLMGKLSDFVAPGGTTNSTAVS